MCEISEMKINLTHRKKQLRKNSYALEKTAFLNSVHADVTPNVDRGLT